MLMKEGGSRFGKIYTQTFYTRSMTKLEIMVLLLSDGIVLTYFAPCNFIYVIINTHILKETFPYHVTLLILYERCL